MPPSPAVGDRGERLVFVVGAPRSGTTWLQRLLGAHPAVVTTQETGLLDRYCRSWYDVWADQLPDDPERWQRARHRGLPAVLTAEELDGHVVGLARDVYAKALSLKPGAHVVVDKNPDYSRHTPLIRRMFPAAAVLHIVRDGRDVAASILAASRGWGRDWAPGRMRDAARTWRTCVEAANSAAGSGRYLQVRYEDLLADGPAVLAECFRFADVAAEADECRRIVERFDRRNGTATGDDPLVWSGEVVRRLGGPPAEPGGFHGEGRPGRWRTLTPAERLAFHVVAGDLLRRLDYAADDGWVGATRARRLAATAAEHGSASASRLGWRLHTLLGRRGLYVHLARVQPYGRAPAD